MRITSTVEFPSTPADGRKELMTLNIRLHVGLALFCSAAIPALACYGGFWPILLLPLGEALHTVWSWSRLDAR